MEDTGLLEEGFSVVGWTVVPDEDVGCSVVGAAVDPLVMRVHVPDGFGSLLYNSWKAIWKDEACTGQKFLISYHRPFASDRTASPAQIYSGKKEKYS